MVKFIMGYNDDNHDTMYWFDKEYIGDDAMNIAEQMFSYGMEEGLYSNVGIETLLLDLDTFADAELTEEEIDCLHNYLCFPKTIDSKVWNALTKKDFKSAIVLIKNL